MKRVLTLALCLATLLVAMPGVVPVASSHPRLLLPVSGPPPLAPQGEAPALVPEQEPNNSFETAQDVGPANVNVQISAAFDPDRVGPGSGPCPREFTLDPDFFAFSLYAAGTVTVSRGFGKIELFDSSGTLLAQGVASLQQSLAPGRYVLGCSYPEPSPGSLGACFVLEIRGGTNAPLAADLGIGLSIDPVVPITGNQFTYTATVTNAGPNPAFGQVTSSIPAGSTFAGASSAQAAVTGPSPGGPGMVTARVANLAPGASASVAITVNVTAAPGAVLQVAATVTGDQSSDPNASNDTASIEATVIDGATADLTFDPPSGGPLAPPRNLVVMLRPGGGAVEGSTQWVDLRPGVASPGAQVIGYKIYRSNQPNVQPTPGNLFATLPPTQTSTTAQVASGGTYFVVTACYPEGESVPSNEAEAGSTLQGPRLATVKFSAKKITLTGTGFVGPVQVFLDGLGFTQPAKLARANNKVNQKGTLTNGKKLADFLTSGRTLQLGVLNADGGLTGFDFVVP